MRAAEFIVEDSAISLRKLGKFHKDNDVLADFVPERLTHRFALHPDKWESTFFSLTNKDPRKLKYFSPEKIDIPSGTLVGDMAIANKFYRSKSPEEQEQYAQEYKQSLKPYPVDVNQYRMPELLIPKQGLAEGKLSVDVPNEDWLQEKIDYAKSKGRNSHGVPYMGSTTAYVQGTPPRARVMRLASLPGMKNEQMNVRKSDLKWLMDYMEKTGKLPPMGNSPDHEYLPYIMVAYNGEAWVNEGNHRIMAAYRLNWQDMPIEIRYFDGGERIKTGPMAPEKIGLGEVDVPKTESMTEIFEPDKQNWKWRRQSSDEAFASFVVGDREYQWHAFTGESNPTKWEIQFRLMRVPTDPDGLDLFGQTGTGNSAQVLSTAVDITRSFLQTYGLDKVEEITFNAKEDSRIDLYAKMIKRLLPNWDLSSRKSLSYGMQFTLTDPRAYDKPENKITEKIDPDILHPDYKFQQKIGLV